jgi:cephalosporin-C deacetylase
MATSEEIRKFWAQTRAVLAKTSMEASVEPVESHDPFMAEIIKTRLIYTVVMSSFERRRIRAWYVVPAAPPPQGGWPAILEFPGYNGVLSLPIQLVQYGYATLTLFPRGQGESRKEWTIEHDTRLTYNVMDRERYYYRGAYMDCVRGIDFLCSRPEIDARRIGVWGASQGGGLSFTTASLDRRVTAAVAAVPWLCNLEVAAGITHPPFVELYDYLKQHPEQRQQVFATLAYFDPLNLAQDIACPILVAGATIDPAHPLETIMPVFERIRSLKSLVVYPDLDHEYRTDFINHAKVWIDRYLR